MYARRGLTRLHRTSGVNVKLVVAYDGTGFHGFAVNDGLRTVNVYAIEDGDGLVLIDSGWALEAGETALESALGALGHGFEDVRRFLVTHVHRDHYTQAVAVRRELGRATIDLGIGEKPTIDLFNSDDLTSDPTVDRLRLAGAHDIADGWRKMFEGAEPDFDIWQYPDRWLDGEHTIDLGDRELRAVRPRTTPMKSSRSSVSSPSGQTSAIVVGGRSAT